LRLGLLAYFDHFSSWFRNEVCLKSGSAIVKGLVNLFTATNSLKKHDKIVLVYCPIGKGRSSLLISMVGMSVGYQQ
jgi:hypothetical protein